MSGDSAEVMSSTLFKDNPEWKDVTPIYPTKEEEGAVKIAVSEAFLDAFAYLRAVMQTKEMSPRVFLLTQECIQLNAANYTVWQFRRDLLQALKVDLSKELEYLDDIIQENPKNYQVWHHRRAIIEWKGPEAIAQELAFTQLVLEDESKNYHAWQHRQWVVRTFSDKIDADLEISFALKLIMVDPRNNSAWNYRYFILQLKDLLDDQATLDVELNLCKQLAEKMPNNESVWSYLSGLLLNNGVSSNTFVVSFVEDLYERTEKQSRSPYLVSFLCDILLENIANGKDAPTSFNKVVELYEELCELDPVRRNYWKHQQKFAENSFQKQTYKTVAK